MYEGNYYEFSEEKNGILKAALGFGFERIIDCIQSGKIMASYPHWNQEKYPGQSIYEILVEDYVYVVPYVQKGRRCFLKTFYASRKANKKYQE